VTIRCWREDLGLAPRPLLDTSDDHPFLRKFCTYGSLNPAGSQRVQAIKGAWISKVPFGNHYRGATWHDRELDIVWLVGYGLRLGGERADVYERVVSLFEKGRLLPTVDDYDIYFQERDARALPAMVAELRALLRHARVSDHECSTIVANLVQVTVYVEQIQDPAEAPTGADADPEILEDVWLAVSTQNLQDGWLDVIRAALLPTVDASGWEFTTTFPGREHVATYELRFHHLHGRDGTDTVIDE
jgi:hypothetical protein